MTDERFSKDRSVALYVMLVGTFVFSQNITWRLLLLFPNLNQVVSIKSCSLYQTSASSIYVFLVVLLTSDRELVRNFFEKESVLALCINKLIYVVIIFFALTINMLGICFNLLVLPEKEVKDKLQLTWERISKFTKELSSSAFSVKIMSGLLCFIFLILVWTVALPEETISLIADVFSLIIGIISFSLVVCNVKHRN